MLPFLLRGVRLWRNLRNKAGGRYEINRYKIIIKNEKNDPSKAEEISTKAR